MTYDDIHARFSDLFSGVGCGVVVAGGAVRDGLMGRQPKDFDVFVLEMGFTKPERENVKAKLADIPTLDQLDFHKSEPYLVETVRVDDAIVQVMTTPCKTAEELLNTFDWNVCLFAYDGQLHQRCDVSDIAPGKALSLQKVTYPMSSLRRGFRFSERFGMEFKRDDIVELCRQVVANADKAVVRETPTEGVAV